MQARTCPSEQGSCSARAERGWDRPGFLGTFAQVSLNFRVPGIGRLFIIETVTPVAPTLQRVLHAVYAQPHIPRLVAKAILASTIRAYEQARDPCLKDKCGCCDFQLWAQFAALFPAGRSRVGAQALRASSASH